MTSGTISLLQPVVTSQLGTINNLIQVKKSDFEVFDALQVDSLECSDTSGQPASRLFSTANINSYWKSVIIFQYRSYKQTLAVWKSMENSFETTQTQCYICCFYW